MVHFICIPSSFHTPHLAYDDALGTLCEALGISEWLGNPLAIAEALELSGYIHMHRSGI